MTQVQFFSFSVCLHPSLTPHMLVCVCCSGNGQPLGPVSARLQSQPSGLLPAAAAHPRQHGGADPLVPGTANVPCPSLSHWTDRRTSAPALWPAPPRAGVYAHQPTAGQPAASDGADP